MSKFSDRLQHAWNAFMNKDPTYIPFKEMGSSYSYRPDRIRFSRGNEKTVVTSVYNRISMDCAAIEIKHVRLDYNKRYVEDIDSGLNNCLTLEANIDQTGRAFIQDVVQSMLDEGTVAIVPVDTNIDIRNNNSFDIETLRTGKITEWFPKHVRVNLYNDRTGQKEDVILPKDKVAIIENPLYSIINEPNSTMQRLIRKLSLLDIVDEQQGAGKLDLIIQLPYIIKTEARQKQAETRRKSIEDQLANSKYGIAYTDGTEHITQLNRSVDNQLQNQVEYLTNLLYSQLGLTTTIMDGTANAETMTNYYNRTIEPILSAISTELKRKFLTKTARTQGQSIEFFRDPFKLAPVNQIADMADKFTRNEIMTSNEFRQIVGLKPAQDPGADELRNKNITQSNDEKAVTEDNIPVDEVEEAQGINPEYDGVPPEDLGGEPAASVEAMLQMPMSELEALMNELQDETG